MVDFKAVARGIQTQWQEAQYAKDPILWARDKSGDFFWSKQREVMESLVMNKRTLVASCHGSGKAQRSDEWVRTANRGWVRAGDITTQDRLFDEHGRPCRVVAVRRWQDRPTWRLSFSDGATVDVDENHEWNTITLRERPRKIADWRDHWGRARTRTTKEIVETLRTSGGQINHRIPIARPIQAAGAAPAVDPYLLGYWLGDGSASSGSLTYDEGIREHVAAAAARAGLEMGPAIGRSGTRGRTATVYGLVPGLKAVGVLGDKHIPESVLDAPVEYRIQVAQGLLDSDGHAARQGTVSLDLCNERLALSALELFRGLGVSVQARPSDAKLYGRVTSTRYRMNFTPVGWAPFTLAYKRNQFESSSNSSRPTCRTITKADYLGRTETVCFEVDSPSHLYLVGESLIPTHNSFLASRAAGWWLDTHPHDPTETRVITTAPSWNQVRNVMWAYLEAVKSSAGMGGRINGKAEWTFPGFTIPTAMGRKPADYDDSTFQGFHPTYPLVVIDEAGGVSENIFTSVETITTNEGARILAIANPDNPNSYMAKIWREQEALPESQRDWNLIRISAFDTPNFTGERVPEKMSRNLLQKDWVADAERRWGKEDPRYQSKVLAVFPEIGEDGLFNLGRVLESMNSYNDFDYDTQAPVVLGVDVGLSVSGDFSVIAANQDGKVTILDKVKGWDGNRLARRIGEWCDVMKVSEVRVDAIGVGRGVQAVLDNHVPDNVRVSWIVGNEASPDNLKWYNFRAAMYDTVSQKINRGELAIPPEEAQGEKTEGLFDEFRAIRYEYRGSRLLLESKEQIKKNIQRKGKGKSPDVLDAIVYACLDLDELTGREGETITSDTLLAESDDLFAADEWGNEVWSFAPA